MVAKVCQGLGLIGLFLWFSFLFRLESFFLFFLQWGARDFAVFAFRSFELIKMRDPQAILFSAHAFSLRKTNGFEQANFQTFYGMRFSFLDARTRCHFVLDNLVS